MPISVLCPECDAPVNAPDSAAGKRAKCPKCGGVMILPGEVVEAPPKSKPRVVVEDDDERPVKKKPSRRDEDDDEDDERPKKKSSRRPVVDEDDDEEEERPKKKKPRVVVDEDEDDEEDDRPRKKGKGKAKKKAGPPMALLLGGGVLLLALIAGGVYFAFSGGSSSGGGGGGGGGGGKKGTNWVAFDAPDGSFTAAFPDGAPSAKSLSEISDTDDRQRMAENDQKMQAAEITSAGWVRNHAERRYIVVVVSFPPAVAQAMPVDVMTDQMMKSIANKVTTFTPFAVGSFKGKQFVDQDKANKWVFARVGTAGAGKIVMVVVESKTELKADDADGTIFFDKFQWKK